jgi:serine/threonine-protein kinase
VEHPEVPVDLLVKAVLDGRPVDWDTAESSASSDDQRKQIRHFRTLAAIAALHRESEATETGGPSAHAELWGSLRLLERIGHGSFGDVYRAWDTKLDREVALKLRRHRDAPGDASEAQALEEGRLLARIRHPNVATVFGADRIGDRVGIWMEFIHGRTLEQALRSHGALGAKEATSIGLDLCLALSAVHRAGLIHRDVKAQNVMREDGGRIVLMDFGAGRDAVEERPAELAGTPLYLPPEIFAGASATVRSDIYSLGVLLYHLVTASYPVKGRTTAELRQAHAVRRRSWLRDERPDLPDRFVQVVEHALAFEPNERYESAGSMEAALARIVTASDSAAVTPAADGSAAATPIELPPHRRIPSRAWAIGAAIAAAVVVAAALPNSWRHKLGAPGGSPPAQSPGGAATLSSETVHKVTLRGWLGAPSPDGTLFSIADDSGNVALVELATGHVRPVTTDAVRGAVPGPTGGQYAESSAISADNRFVAYTWYALDGKYELRVVDTAGKRPRVVLRSDTFSYLTPLQWSPDGAAIMSALGKPDLSTELALVSVTDGTVRPIKDLGTTPTQHASLSPDGRFVVYDAPQAGSVGARDIFIIGADGSGERRLVEHPSNDTNPVWTPDGGSVLFVSDRSGMLDLWSVPVAGGIAHGEPEVMRRNIGRIAVRGLTATGSLYYDLTVGAVDVYAADLVNGTVRTPATVSTSYAGSNLNSVWSPDSRYVAYASRRGSAFFDRGATTLVIRDVQTNEQRELVPPALSFLPHSWFPDGRHVLAGGIDAAGRYGNYQIDVDTGRMTPIVQSTDPAHDDDIRVGRAMPNGRIVYFNVASHAFLARNIQTGAEDVLLDARAEGIEVGVARCGVSPDGQTLAFTASVREGETVTSSITVKIPGDGPRRELVHAKSPAVVLFQDWTPDGQWLLFTRSTGSASDPTALWRVSIHSGDPQPLGLSMVGLRAVSVRPDGSQITFTAGWPKKEIYVMENFLSR